jgi:polyphosphate kinase 2 (PPK2 family)
LEEWIRTELRVVAIFEGRDTAGKGGIIKRITALLNPRYCRVVVCRRRPRRNGRNGISSALGTCLQRRDGPFDRSWYNRAGERHGLLPTTSTRTHADMSSRADAGSLSILIKYWPVSDAEQERRFARINDPSKRWKLSPGPRTLVDHSEMFAYSDIKEAPWYVVETDNKRAAHLNLIKHFLSLIPYEEVPHEGIKLPPRQKRNYNRPPKSSQTMVPIRYEVE